MTIVIIFLILIFLLLVFFGMGAFLAWQKVSVFLTWNTRYESVEYEQAVTSPKRHRPSAPPSKTEQQGRKIMPVDDLVDLADLDIDTAVKMAEEVSNGY